VTNPNSSFVGSLSGSGLGITNTIHDDVIPFSVLMSSGNRAYNQFGAIGQSSTAFFDGVYTYMGVSGGYLTNWTLLEGGAQAANWGSGTNCLFTNWVNGAVACALNLDPSAVNDRLTNSGTQSFILPLGVNGRVTNKWYFIYNMTASVNNLTVSGTVHHIYTNNPSQ